MVEKQDSSADLLITRVTKLSDASSNDVSDSGFPLDEALIEAKQHYNDLFSLAADGVVVHDLATTPAAGRFVQVNPAICELLGYTKEEMYSLTPLDVTAPENHPAVAVSDRPELMRNGILRHEKTLIAKDGRSIAADLNTRTFQARGRTLVMTIVRDITKRKNAEKALHESEERLRLAAHAAQVGTYIYVFDACHGNWSSEIKALWGLKPDDPVALDQGMLPPSLHPDDRKHFLAAIVAANNPSGSGVLQLDYRIIRRDGSVRWLHIHGHTDFRKDGARRRPWRSVGAVTDITDRKLVEEELSRARAFAEHRAAEFESFISSMSEGVIMTDSVGNAVYVNCAAVRILGDHPCNSIQDRMEQYGMRRFDGSAMKAEETPTHRALQGETISCENYRFTSALGKETVIAISSSPVCSTDGGILGAATVFQDITDRADLDRQRDALYQREHRIAQTLQEALLPSSHCDMPGVHVAVRYEPLLQEAMVGGDFYDIFDLGNGKFGILLGDVSGKGLCAAIRVAAARYAVRSYAYIDTRPSRVMTLANEALCRDQKDGVQMVTVFFAVVDTNVGSITYANGGHEPPLLMRSSGTIEELSVEGRALGVSTGFEYPEGGRVLHAGDTVAMFTDGLTEARPNASSLFGMEGAISCLTSFSQITSPGAVADGLLAAARKHAGGSLMDDAAIVVLTYRGATTPAE